MTFYSQDNIGELADQDLIARCVQIERLRKNPRAHGMSEGGLIDELNRYHDVLEARGMSFSEQRTKIDRYLRS